MAKKFKFRLEKVLQFRDMVKTERMRDLMEANRNLTIEQNKLAELDQAFLRNLIAGNSDHRTQDIELIGKYSERLSLEIQHQKERIIEAEKSVETARQAYVLAAQEAESISKLKEQKQSEYQEYLLKEDEKFLDELATQRNGSQFKE